MTGRVFLLILIIFTFTLSIRAKSPSDKMLWDKIQRSYNKKSYRATLSRIRKFLKKHPKSRYRLEARILKGKVYIQLKRRTRGVEYLDRLIHKNKKLYRRADLMAYMAKTSETHSILSAKQRIDYHNRAIALYLKGEKNKEIISLYYSLISVYRNRSYHGKNLNIRKLRRSRDRKRILKYYDRIIGLSDPKKAKNPDQIKEYKSLQADALYYKGTYIDDIYYDNRKLALKFYREVIKRYPKEYSASRARMELARYYSSQSLYKKAVKEYRQVILNHPNSKMAESAELKLDAMTLPFLLLGNAGITRPGGKVLLDWSARNMKTIHLSAWRVDLFDVLKKSHQLDELNKYPLGGLKPVVKWNFQITDRGNHYVHSFNDSGNPSIPVPIRKNGAYIVQAAGSNPEGLQYKASILVIISRIALITKAGQDKSILYTLDSRSGRPVPKVDVLIQKAIKIKKGKKDYDIKYEHHSFSTDDDGFLALPLQSEDPLIIIAKRGDDYAVSKNYSYRSIWYKARYSNEEKKKDYKVYGYTDRPVYRPNQTVRFKEIIRIHGQKKYMNFKNQKVEVLIKDSRDNEVSRRTLTSNEYGTVSGSWKIGSEPKLGKYKIYVIIGDQEIEPYTSAGNYFRVEEYKKPEYQVTVTPDKKRYKLGDKVRFKVQSKYYFGTPVRNAKVEYTVYAKPYYHKFKPKRKYSWYYSREFYKLRNPQYAMEQGKYFGYYYSPELMKKGEVKTNDDGKAYVTLRSKRIKDYKDADIIYSITVTVVDDSRRHIVKEAKVKITQNPFYIYLNTNQYLYNGDEKVNITIRGINGNGEGVPFNGEVKVYSLGFRENPVRKKDPYDRKWKPFIERADKIVYHHKVYVDSKGNGQIRFISSREGYFKAVVTAKTSKGREIKGICYLWAVGKSNHFKNYKYKEVEVVTHKDTYRPGEEARILINTIYKNSYVLLTLESNNVHYHKMVFIKGQSKVVTVAIPSSIGPKVRFVVDLVRNNYFYFDSLETIILPEDKLLNVKITSPKETFQPQEEAEFEVRVTNQKGEGVQGEFSLAFVDTSVFYIQQEYGGDIRSFYYGAKYQAKVSTGGSFRFDPYGYGFWIDDTEKSLPPRIGFLSIQIFTDMRSSVREKAIRKLKRIFNDPNTSKETKRTIKKVLRQARRNELIIEMIGGRHIHADLTVNLEPDDWWGEQDEIIVEHWSPLNRTRNLEFYRNQVEFPEETDIIYYDRRKPSGTSPNISIQYIDRLDGLRGYSVFEEVTERNIIGLGLKKARIRKDFPDTMFWNAHLETNEEGVAKVKVKFPDSLTSWKVKSIVVTKDSKVGVSDLKVVTKKKLIVRLQSPRFFREKDRVLVSGIVHNDMDEDKIVRVRLQVSKALEIVGEFNKLKDVNRKKPLKRSVQRNIKVPGHGKKRLDFMIHVKDMGIDTLEQGRMAELSITAQTDKESDAMERRIPILENGVERVIRHNGVLNTTKGRKEAKITLNRPKSLKVGSEELIITLNSGVAGVIMDSIPYLIQYPYGCVEQTMSRFLPAVVVRKTLKSLGVSLEKTAMDQEKKSRYFSLNPVYKTSEMNKVISKGLKRLYDFQNSNGSWGWWSDGRSDPYMTSYVLYGLFTAHKSGVKVDKKVIKKGVDYLVEELTRVRDKNETVSHYRDDSKMVYMLYALSLVDVKRFINSDYIELLITRYWKNREDLDIVSKAYLALIFYQIGEREKAKIALKYLENFIEVDQKDKTAWFHDDDSTIHSYESSIEGTAISLMTFLTIDPKNPYIPMMVKRLVEKRKGSRWHSTKDSALAIYALAKYLSTSDDLNPDLTVDISYGEHFKRSFRVTKENLLTKSHRIVLPSNVLRKGDQKVIIRIKGSGKLYYTTEYKYYSKQNIIKAEKKGVEITRRYFKLIPKDVKLYKKVWNSRRKRYTRQPYRSMSYIKKEIKSGTRIHSGDLIEVELTLRGKEALEYVMVEDFKPAGCEPVALRSGSSNQNIYGSNIELRDNKVVFFISYVSKGLHKLRYRLRAEIPGRFHAMPCRLQAMYSPNIHGMSKSQIVHILDKSAR